MRFFLRIMLATAGLSVALTVGWVMAFLSFAATHHPDHQSPTIKRPLPTINVAPSMIDARYVATTIDHSKSNKGRRVYHVVTEPPCSYAGRINHPFPFKTCEEAEAAGYEPCSRCLPRQIARAK